MTDETGRLLRDGAYRIEALLAESGFSRVYLAARPDGTTVVLKEFFPAGFVQRLSDGRVRATRGKAARVAPLKAAFLAEATLLARLRHPGIVPLLDRFAEAGTQFLVLPHLPGADLEDVARNHRDWLTPARFLRLLDRILSAASHLHAEGIVHGDLATDNLLLDAAGQAVLIDLGSAVADDEARKPVRTVKDGFTAPELYDPARRPDPRSDVYALGATLYRLASGVLPAPAPLRLAARRADRPDPLPALDAPALPDGLLDVIEGALALDPEHRPVDAGALRRAVLAALTEAVADPTASDARSAACGRPAAPATASKTIPGTIGI